MLGIKLGLREEQPVFFTAEPLSQPFYLIAGFALFWGRVVWFLRCLWLSWNLLCRLGWPGTEILLPPTGMRDLQHCAWPGKLWTWAWSCSTCMTLNLGFLDLGFLCEMWAAASRLEKPIASPSTSHLL